MPGQPVDIIEPVLSQPSRFEAAPNSVFDAPRQRAAELQMRAARAFAGFHEGLPTQRIQVGAWYKPSTRVMCIGVGVYALVLFLFALWSQ
jgi:hypothetical protein